MRNFLLVVLLAVSFLGTSVAHADIFDYYPGYAGSYCILSEEDKTAEFCEVVYETDATLDRQLVFPSHVTINGKEYRIASIGENAFFQKSSGGYDCYIEAVTLPDSLTDIKKEAFKGCDKLKSVIFPSTLERIGESAFSKCASLDSIGLPSSLKEIGDYAFNNCSSLTSVVIPDSVLKIGKESFYRCDNVQNVVIGKGIENIGYNSFADCYQIHNVYTLASKPPYSWWNAFEISPELIEYEHLYRDYICLYAPEESLDSYKEGYAGSNVSVQFNDFFPLPGLFTIFSSEKYMVVQGEETSLSYSVFNPGNVEIVECRWESFNPNAVAVDNGVVKGLRAGEVTHISLIMTDAEGNEYVSECRVEVERVSSVDAIDAVEPVATEVYSLGGTKVGNTAEGLAPGIYIEKNGKTSRKIMVR